MVMPNVHWWHYGRHEKRGVRDQAHSPRRGRYAQARTSRWCRACSTSPVGCPAPATSAASPGQMIIDSTRGAIRSNSGVTALMSGEWSYIEQNRMDPCARYCGVVRTETLACSVP